VKNSGGAVLGVKVKTSVEILPEKVEKVTGKVSLFHRGFSQDLSSDRRRSKSSRRARSTGSVAGSGLPVGIVCSNDGGDSKADSKGSGSENSNSEKKDVNMEKEDPLIAESSKTDDSGNVIGAKDESGKCIVSSPEENNSVETVTVKASQGNPVQEREVYHIGIIDIFTRFQKQSSFSRILLRKNDLNPQSAAMEFGHEFQKLILSDRVLK